MTAPAPGRGGRLRCTGPAGERWRTVENGGSGCRSLSPSIRKWRREVCRNLSTNAKFSFFVILSKHYLRDTPLGCIIQDIVVSQILRE